MNDIFLILQNQMDAMSTIMNALPDEAYKNSSMETFLIVQRRMEESELKKALEDYNEIFTKRNQVTKYDISKSAASYIKIKILVEYKLINFDAFSIRDLIKEYKAQITKVNNIIHLSRVNSMTADSYQKERILLTLEKNEALKAAFEERILQLEKRIEKLPLPEISEEQQSEKTEKELKNEKEQRWKNQTRKGIASFFEQKKSEKEIVKKLKEKEKEQAVSLCVEIPFYDHSLTFTEKAVCKDIPEFSLFKRKSNIYFGLSENVMKGTVRNLDESLLELTEATEEFYQFMTIDFLGDDYELSIFSEEQKKGLYQYFDFITRCFEKHMGTVLSIREYLEFKNYYNQLVLQMLEFEKKKKHDFYRAAYLADQYRAYMDCYGMEYDKDTSKMIEDIIHSKYSTYVDEIQLVLENHIILDDARKDLKELIYYLENFYEEAVEETPGEESQNLDVESLALADEDVDLPVIQIKVQLQNSDLEVTDEAMFSASNLRKAVHDYLSKDAYLKKIGLYMNEKDIFLFAAKGGSISVPIIDSGSQGQLVEAYEEKIRNVMMEMTQ